VSDEPSEPASDEASTATADESAGASANDEPRASTRSGDAGKVTNDLRDILRNLAQPVIESWDARLRTQVDARVDESVDEKIDAAIQDRLAVLERAVADLDRQVNDLRDRLDLSGT
jgi:hypothetical protein